MSKIMDWEYYVTMPDGSVWSVPVRLIAEHRARYYAEVDRVPYEESLAEDTLPFFAADTYEIADWAKNNLNWSDVVAQARRVSAPGAVDYQEGWVNGQWWINRSPEPAS